LRALVGSLPAKLPAAVLVVLHMPAGWTGALASILSRSGCLPAVTARTDVELERPRRAVLQSTNEELQSTNDELRAINDAMRERSVELDRVNEFLESILTSIRAGVIVVDQEMRVLIWNRGAEDLWGLCREEVAGLHLLNLDVGFPLVDLRPMLGSALVDPLFPTETELAAVHRRGREIHLRLVCSALRTKEGTSQGALLFMAQRE
jgi:two-component system CheB/CheR fusion protein